MPAPLRVLLVAPFGGARWTSISAYANGIAAWESGEVSFDVAEAPWWNPPSLLEGAGRKWWREGAVRKAAAGHYDVVHLTDQALGHHARRFNRQAVMVTCHDLMPFAVPRYYRTRIEGTVKRAFLRHSIAGMLTADRIVAVSDYTAGELRRLHRVPAGRLSVVPNMVRPAFRPVEDAEDVLARAGITLPRRPRVLSVGHAGPYKGLESLLEALAMPGLGAATLVRVGSRLTSRQSGLATTVGVAPRIAELGRLPDDLLAAVYSSCDVLAQPSIAEGFGVPVIEAMACGLPVVVSAGGALPEVAGDAGLIVTLDRPHHAGSLATALGQVCYAGDATTEARREGGLRRAQAFAPEAVMPRLLDAYRAAIANRG
jgi:glycosyltransferase involved in cell wall biosynthesis